MGDVSDWPRNEYTVRGEPSTMAPDLAIHKIAGFIRVSNEVLEDAPAMAVIGDMLRRAIRRRTHPWEFPDRPMMPTFVLFSRPVERVLAFLDLRKVS